MQSASPGRPAGNRNFISRPQYIAAHPLGDHRGNRRQLPKPLDGLARVVLHVKEDNDVRISPTDFRYDTAQRNLGLVAWPAVVRGKHAFKHRKGQDTNERSDR